MNPLRRWNLLAAFLHFAQSAVMTGLVASEPPVYYQVIATYETTKPGNYSPVAHWIGPVAPRWMTAAFLWLCFVAHALISTWLWPSYWENVKNKHNWYRWAEYSVSATLMILVIALVTGVADIAALIGFAGCNVAMILFGDGFERHLILIRERAKPVGAWERWHLFVYGSVAGAIPWLGIFVYLILSAANAGVPAFVVAMYVTVFLSFMGFAGAAFIGGYFDGPFSLCGMRFQDPYLVGEYTYVALSLFSKSILAWQFYAGSKV